jgi:hypothetical protein
MAVTVPAFVGAETAARRVWLSVMLSFFAEVDLGLSWRMSSGK